MFRGQIACHADDDILLKNIEFQGAVEGVPPAENYGKVGPHFVADDGVMNTMHAGRHYDFIQGPLQEQGQAKVGVLEQISRLVGYFVQHKSEDVHP